MPSTHVDNSIKKKQCGFSAQFTWSLWYFTIVLSCIRLSLYRIGVIMAQTDTPGCRIDFILAIWHAWFYTWLKIFSDIYCGSVLVLRSHLAALTFPSVSHYSHIDLSSFSWPWWMTFQLIVDLDKLYNRREWFSHGILKFWLVDHLEIIMMVIN